MNYEEMSDFEINKQVASIIYDENWWHKNGKVIINRQGTDIFGDKFLGKVEVDYCNNASDAMPILIETKIGFKWVNDSCTASSVLTGYHEFSSSNPLRAAMIVFIMMNEEQK